MIHNDTCLWLPFTVNSESHKLGVTHTLPKTGCDTHTHCNCACAFACSCASVCYVSIARIVITHMSLLSETLSRGRRSWDLRKPYILYIPGICLTQSFFLLLLSRIHLPFWSLSLDSPSVFVCFDLGCLFTVQQRSILLTQYDRLWCVFSKMILDEIWLLHYGWYKRLYPN